MTRVGITGHQRLEDYEAWSWVASAIRRELTRLRPPLVAVTSLAVGSDQLLARLVLKRRGTIHAVLPSADIERSFSPDDVAAFRALARQATVEVLDVPGTDEDAYLAAGQRVVELSDIMIAVWNGQPAKGKGGTADIVAFARRRGVPLVHIDPVSRTVHYREIERADPTPPAQHTQLPAVGLVSPSSWGTILKHYDSNGRDRARKELAWFQSQPTLEAAIRNASLAIDGRGKRYSHQSRLSRTALEEGYRQLVGRASAIAEAPDFDTVFRLVSDAVAEVRGLGELWRYDTSLRIGARLGFLPELVYLHAGTRSGARRLGLDTDRASLGMESIPEALRALSPHEVEDILCIYKDRLPQSKGCRY